MLPGLPPPHALGKKSWDKSFSIILMTLSGESGNGTYPLVGAYWKSKKVKLDLIAVLFEIVAYLYPKQLSVSPEWSLTV